jgi:hypothetical protein
MTRIRQWVLAGVFALLLSLSFASLASADPKDSGFEKGSFSKTSSDPKDGGFGP